MARDELFSFGDEDLGGTDPSSEPEVGSGTIGVLERPPLEDVHVDESSAEGAWPSRGGSTERSSEKRQPPPLRLYLGVTAVVLVGSALLVRALIGGAGDESAPVAQSAVSSSKVHGPVVVGTERAGFVEASKQKAAQAQRARQRRAATRHRSQRRRAPREKHGGGRENRSGRRAGSSTSTASTDRLPATRTEGDPDPATAPPPAEPSPAPEGDEAAGTTAPPPDPPPASPTEVAQGQFGVESAGGTGSGIGG